MLVHQTKAFTRHATDILVHREKHLGGPRPPSDAIRSVVLRRKRVMDTDNTVTFVQHSVPLCDSDIMPLDISSVLVPLS